MYASKSIETPGALRQSPHRDAATSVDLESLRSSPDANSETGTASLIQEQLAERLERVLGPAGFDLELSLQAAEPYVVGCRLTIAGAVRSSISDPYGTPSAASEDAISKVAKLFRIPL